MLEAIGVDTSMQDVDPLEKVSPGPTATGQDNDDPSTKSTGENETGTTVCPPAMEEYANSDADTEIDCAGSTHERGRTHNGGEAGGKRPEGLKMKYKDWPLKDTKGPHENDVMYGRGGGTNHHPGDKRYSPGYLWKSFLR